MRGSIWATLGIEPTNDTLEVKRAYAGRLKQVHPEDDPEGFQALRAAYEQATNMARNGWAVPPPPSADGDAFDDDLDDDVWPDIADRAWTRADRDGPTFDHDPDDKRFGTTSGNQDQSDAGVTAQTQDLPDDIRAELAREQDLNRAHQGLCDRFAALIANPDGDRHEALAAMLAIFRSPAMDGLQTHVRTEHWLAWMVGSGGAVTDDLVEPLIQFFGWNDRPIGVDLHHAGPVLQRRESAIILRQLQHPENPDHAAWRALSDKPTARGRMRQRFTLGLEARVFALLDQLDYEFPNLASRLNTAATARWRTRRRRPVLPAVFLWALLLLPPLAAGVGAASQAFGPPDAVDFLALWMFVLSVMTGAGAIWLHGLARPRARWRDEGSAWRASAWVRLGWAPIGAVLVLLSSVLPIPFPWVAAYWLLLGPLVCWTGVTNAHFQETRTGLQGGFFMAMIPLAWLVIHAHGPQWTGLCWVGAGVTLVAHHGRPALEAAWADMDAVRRRLTALGLAIGVIGAAAAVATVPVVNAQWPVRAIAAAALLLLVLASRPVRFTQSPAAHKLWFAWMRFGWVPCGVAVWFAPFTAAASATFVGAGLWLAGGALLTFLWEAAPRLDQLLSRRPRRPGALA